MSAAEDLTRRVHDADKAARWPTVAQLGERDHVIRTLARMVDDVLNRHRDDGTGWCEHCCAPSGLARQYPCPERVALERLAKGAGL